MQSSLKRSLKYIYPWLIRIDDIEKDVINKSNKNLDIKNKGLYRRINIIRPRLNEKIMFYLNKNNSLFDFYSNYSVNYNEISADIRRSKEMNKNKEDSKDGKDCNDSTFSNRVVVLPKLLPLSIFSMRFNNSLILDNGDFINIIIFDSVDIEFIQSVSL